MGKRIGLMLANLYQGSSISMWKAFAKAASRHKDGSFFVFPGGKLGEDNGDEYMRNDIFSLVTPESIDGVIIWTSALSGTRDASELRDYALEKSKTMPVVSMGMTIDGCTSVNFDAYQGLLSEIEHMITVHDDRRIAFLRGPETHSSAEARFRAYRDALGKHGIEFDPELVSSPFPWADGYNAMKELIEGRHLVPGKDFTALVAASDMLLLSASNYLSEHGREIPRDLHAGGFNDSEDNILMPTEITTVRMPIDELASESFMLISEICEGRKAESLLLPSALVIRRSCGCSGISGNGDIHAFWNRVRPLISSDEALHAAREILEYMTGKGDDTRLYRYAEIFIASGGDAGALFDAASVYPGAIIPERKDRMHRRIVMEERRAAAKEKQRTQTLTYALDSFKRELLAARSKDSIPAIMLSSFRYLGIDKAFLMLYRDFSFTEFIGGFADHSVVGFVASGKSRAAGGGIGDFVVRRSRPGESADGKLIERELSRGSMGVERRQSQSSLSHAVADEKNDVARSSGPRKCREFCRVDPGRRRIRPFDLPRRIRRMENRKSGGQQKHRRSPRNSECEFHRCPP